MLSIYKGSTRATLGIKRGLPIPALKLLSVSVTTENWVTSLPVPEVVGMAIKGGGGFFKTAPLK
jgi:hypothetical protein